MWLPATRSVVLCYSSDRNTQTCAQVPEFQPFRDPGSSALQGREAESLPLRDSLEEMSQEKKSGQRKDASGELVALQGLGALSETHPQP